MLRHRWLAMIAIILAVAAGATASATSVNASSLNDSSHKCSEESWSTYGVNCDGWNLVIENGTGDTFLYRARIDHSMRVIEGVYDASAGETIPPKGSTGVILGEDWRGRPTTMTVAYISASDRETYGEWVHFYRYVTITKTDNGGTVECGYRDLWHFPDWHRNEACTVTQSAPNKQIKVKFSARVNSL